LNLNKSAFGQDAGDLIRERSDNQGEFQGFGNNQVQSINESEVQPLMNNTTGVTQQNINDFPTSNGTGSGRPNFDQTATMSMSKK
jgi:hypothetical protein